MPNVLPHPASDVVVSLLVHLGVGANADVHPLGDWPVYANKEPDDPDEVIWVVVTAGRSHGRLQPTGQAPRHYGFQVTVRAADTMTGWAKADEIQRELAEQVYNEVVVVGSISYLVQCVSNIGDVIPLGSPPSARGREMFTINALLCARQTELDVLVTEDDDQIIA